MSNNTNIFELTNIANGFNDDQPLHVGDIVRNFSHIAVVDQYRSDIDMFIVKGIDECMMGQKWGVDPSKCEVLKDIPEGIKWPLCYGKMA